MDLSKSHSPALLTEHLIAQARKAELSAACEAFKNDEDLIVAGVTGSGRQILVEIAAQKAGFKIIEMDCIQATGRKRLIEMFWKRLHRAFRDEKNVQLAIEASNTNLFQQKGKTLADLTLADLMAEEDTKDEKLLDIFWELLDFTEELASHCNMRVVVILKNFTYLRSWDREDRWSKSLREKINKHENISYVLIATFGELQGFEDREHSKENQFSGEDIPKIIKLPRLNDASLHIWATLELQDKELMFDPLEDGLERFLEIVQGHFGDALTLVRRLRMLAASSPMPGGPPVGIGREQVEKALKSVLMDFDVVFETLLLLLPATQKRLLECLVLAPTSKPHSLDYTQEHGLPRGGTIQGALKGLEKKGLIYGSDHQYAIAMPLLAQWIKKHPTA